MNNLKLDIDKGEKRERKIRIGKRTKLIKKSKNFTKKTNKKRRKKT